MHKVNLISSFIDARARYDNQILASRFVTSFSSERYHSAKLSETAKPEGKRKKNDLCFF